MGEYLELVGRGSQAHVRCRRCGTIIAPGHENYKLHTPVGEYSLNRAGPQVAPNLDDGRFVLREFYCPGCWTLLDVETNLKGEPFIWDTELA